MPDIFESTLQNGKMVSAWEWDFMDAHWVSFIALKCYTLYPEVYSESCETSKMELLVKIFNV